MSTKTYTAFVPSSLYSYLAAYARVYNAARQAFLKRLMVGEDAAALVKEFQETYKLNKRQVNSIRTEVKAAVSSARECRQRHLKTIEGQLKSVKAEIRTLEKKLKRRSFDNACDVRTRRSIIASKRFGLHQKKRRAYLLENKLLHLKDKPLVVNVPNSGTDFFMMGSKDETAGNQVCQLTTDGILKIRVPASLQEQFGAYVHADGFVFLYEQQEINAALNNPDGQAVTFRFYCRDFIWYAAVSVDVSEVPTQSRSKWESGCIGVDLNPGVIGWAYVDAFGNLQAKGQFRLNLHSKRSNQVEAILSDVAAQLVLVAEFFECPIVIEDLDFSAKTTQLRERGRRYARMLSGFVYSKWQEVLERRCHNRRKHVWSHWHELNNQLRRFRRHSYFITGANSPLELVLPELVLAGSGRKRKRSSKFG